MDGSVENGSCAACFFFVRVAYASGIPRCVRVLGDSAMMASFCCERESDVAEDQDVGDGFWRKPPSIGGKSIGR